MQMPKAQSEPFETSSAKFARKITGRLAASFHQEMGLPVSVEGPRLKGLVCQFHTPDICPPRDARYKFVPRDTKSSRKLLKSASSSITNATV